VLITDPQFDAATLPRLVRYDDETIEFERIEDIGGEGTNRWFRIESTRAHRRAAVRALFESRGLAVSRVIQVKFGTLELARDLPRGKHRQLTPPQVRELYELAELTPPQPEHSGGPQHRNARHPRASTKRSSRAQPTDNRRPVR
jgi:23S rRNA pseudouridine2605 synthase